IVLLASSSGAPQENDPYNNLAQKIATAAQRIVIAPTTDIDYNEIELLSVNPLMPNYSVNTFNIPPFYFSKDNMYRIFNPGDDLLPDAQINKQFRQSQAEIETLKTYSAAKLIISQSILSRNAQETKPKLTYFSAKGLQNVYLHP